MSLRFEINDETLVARVVHLLEIGPNNLCDYDGQEEAACDETPGLDVHDWCVPCRTREAIRILKDA